MVTESPPVEKNDSEKGPGDDHGTREPEMYIGESTETHESPSGTPALAEKESEPEPAVLSPAIQAGKVADGLTERPAEEPTEEEEEEAARRKRVAEKLGKMGGINPLAPRPSVASPPANDEDEKKDSTVSEAVEPPVTSLSSAKLTSETARRESKDSITAPPASLPVHESALSHLPSSEHEKPPRKESTKSVESGDVPEPATQEDGEY
jgi:hypothetical protein